MHINRKNFFSTLLFFSGSIILIFAIFIDVISGKTFTIGYKQFVLILFALVIISLAYFLRFKFDLLINCFDHVWKYLQSKINIIREFILLMNVYLFFFLVFSFSLILILFFMFGVTQVNSFPDYIGAGTPIMLGQLLLSVLGGLICMVPAFFLKEHTQKKWLTAVIALILFIVAAKLWTSLPIETNHFTRMIDSVTQTYYPFSDSRRYDMNVFALLQGRGYGFGSPIQRPVYALFLAVLHVLFHHNYQMIFTAQTIFFSLIPVLLFYLGRKYGNVMTGTIAALLLIFHEYNQIILSLKFTLVNVQMMMSEIFTAFFLIVLCLFIFNWFVNIHSRKLAIITGLGFGVVLLIRTQALALLALFGLYFLYLQIWKKEKVVKQFSLFILAFLLAIIPWMTRNAIQNGNFGLDDPNYLNNILIVNGNNSEISTTEDATILENVVNLVSGERKEYLLRTTSFVTNDVINSMYQFPLFWHFFDLETYINSGKASYPLPYLELSPQQWIMLTIQMLIFISGIYYASKKFGITGTVPIMVYFLYGISGALLGYTGYRFIQPVEWVFLLYWAIGVGSIIRLVIPENLQWIVTSDEKSQGTETYRQNIIIGCFLAIVLILSGLELLIQPGQIFLPMETEEYQSILGNGLQGNQQQEDGYFHPGKDFIGMKGFGMYPIYYDEDSEWRKLEKPGMIYPGVYDHNINWTSEYIESQKRSNKDVLIFVEFGDEVRDIVFDNPQVSDEIENPYLFNNSEIYILGCEMDDYIQAYYIQVNRENGFYEITSADGLPEECPAK